MVNNSRKEYTSPIINGKILTLANIYAPSEDDPDFFNSFFNHLLDFSCEEITIGGDFNLVLDVGKDTKGGLARIIKVFRCNQQFL